jgi:hypothetical protein
MSRLDSFIRRLEAQRSCIDFAARPGNLPRGAIFELGLGNGRTYDHLRTVFRAREIFVFDRRVDPHPDCVPDSRHLFLGEIAETLARAASLFRSQIALVHLDISSSDEVSDRIMSTTIAPLIAEVCVPEALVASDHPLPLSKWQQVSLFEVPKHRYFLYRNAPVQPVVCASELRIARAERRSGVSNPSVNLP